jgi:hypothetical protein
LKELQFKACRHLNDGPYTNGIENDLAQSSGFMNVTVINDNCKLPLLEI